MGTEQKNLREGESFTAIDVTEGADPYSILGVPRDASYETIRRNYREKAKACHPDLGSETNRVEDFKQLNAAYRVLSELHTRATPIVGSPTIRKSVSDTTLSETPNEASSSTLEILREARARLCSGAAREAESLARLALQGAREDKAVYVCLAETLETQGRYTEAVGCLALALQFDKEYVPAWHVLQRLKDRKQSG